MGKLKFANFCYSGAQVQVREPYAEMCREERQDQPTGPCVGKGVDCTKCMNCRVLRSCYSLLTALFSPLLYQLSYLS